MRMAFCMFNTVESLRLGTRSSMLLSTIRLGIYCVNIWSSYLGVPTWDCLLVVVVQ